MKIIDLKKNVAAGKKYDERLAASLQRLDTVREELWNDLVALAMLGPWREWDEQQPAGTRVRFGPKELIESSDANVAALVRLHDRICEVVDELRGNHRDDLAPKANPQSGPTMGRPELADLRLSERDDAIDCSEEVSMAEENGRGEGAESRSSRR
ncbi:MAG TPA: hypothetical protein VMK12_08610 [Anaeromyxobacteraceae bacterium]|nr:hypothetical protein [Anaeromyxobacteraceae bacterium]